MRADRTKFMRRLEQVEKVVSRNSNGEEDAVAEIVRRIEAHRADYRKQLAEGRDPRFFVDRSILGRLAWGLDHGMTENEIAKIYDQVGDGVLKGLVDAVLENVRHI